MPCCTFHFFVFKSNPKSSYHKSNKIQTHMQHMSILVLLNTLTCEQIWSPLQIYKEPTADIYLPTHAVSLPLAETYLDHDAGFNSAVCKSWTDVWINILPQQSTFSNISESPWRGRKYRKSFGGIIHNCKLHTATCIRWLWSHSGCCTQHFDYFKPQHTFRVRWEVQNC